MAPNVPNLVVRVCVCVCVCVFVCVQALAKSRISARFKQSRKKTF